MVFRGPSNANGVITLTISTGPACVMPCDPPLVNHPPPRVTPSFTFAISRKTTAFTPRASDADAITTSTFGGRSLLPPFRIPRAAAAAFSSTAVAVGSTFPGGKRQRLGASADCSAFASALNDQNCAFGKPPLATKRSTTAHPRAPRPTTATPTPLADVNVRGADAATVPRTRMRRGRRALVRSTSAHPVNETRGCVAPTAGLRGPGPAQYVAKTPAAATAGMMHPETRRPTRRRAMREWNQDAQEAWQYKSSN